MFEYNLISGLIFLLIIWSIIWKSIALWRCGRNNQLGWFIVILLISTLGILPIIYLMFFQRDMSMMVFKATVKKAKKKKKKKRK